MRVAMLWLAAVSVHGQAFQPGFVRGVLLSETGQSSGELSVRPAPEQEYRFRFDSKTWIERASERIPGSALRPGELLEIVSDHDPRPLEYARLVHVIERARPKAALETGMYRLPKRHEVEAVDENGNLTYTGIVSSIDGTRLTLRTRFDGEKTVYLRPDTRYLNGGSEAGAAAIEPNARIFVRAGRNLDHEIEAYQIIWGTILEPASPRE
jgi:hypothetical protein